MDKNLEVLKEVCKGVKMGMDAISYVSDKVKEPCMQDSLKHEYSMYNNILTKVDDAFANYGEEPNDYAIGDVLFWHK